MGRQPYAKRECALLYSDVFAPCHNVVSVTELRNRETVNALFTNLGVSLTYVGISFLVILSQNSHTVTVTVKSLSY